MLTLLSRQKILNKEGLRLVNEGEWLFMFPIRVLGTGINTEIILLFLSLVRKLSYKHLSKFALNLSLRSDFQNVTK